ncbi:MAG: hypothetical protein NTX25_14065 [Proteobacteria bacterium]|nr:hypothetical protein [Pseudomonadota bacterium]
MLTMRPLVAICAISGFLACSEGSQTKTSRPDRPLNFSAENAATAQRGDLIEATHVVSLSPADIQNKLAPVLSGLNTDVKNGVHIYKIKYQTVSPGAAAKPLIASGLILLPDSKASSYPWISLQHGTITSKAEAPSVTPREGLFEASQGFLTLAMDYIGFGASSNVFHPYFIEEAYASAGVDMLKAAYKFASLNNLGTGPLFLKGYSEGGYATLALQKEIELNHPEFPLAASAPSAGVYDIDATANELMARDSVHPVNIPFMILSYASWLAKDDFNPDNIFVMPSAELKKLYTGSANYDYIYTNVPNKSAELIKPKLTADFLAAEPGLNESIKLHTWLKEQSLTNKNWSPKTPTYFWHCQDDEVVPFAASVLASKVFASPLVTLIPIPSPEAKKFTHGTCPAIFMPTLEFAKALKQKLAQ